MTPKTISHRGIVAMFTAIMTWLPLPPPVAWNRSPMVCATALMWFVPSAPTAQTFISIRNGPRNAGEISLPFILKQKGKPLSYGHPHSVEMPQNPSRWVWKRWRLWSRRWGMIISSSACGQPVSPVQLFDPYRVSFACGRPADYRLFLHSCGFYVF